MDLMNKAVEKEKDLLNSRLRSDLKLRIIDQRTFDRKSRDVERWLDAEQKDLLKTKATLERRAKHTVQQPTPNSAP